MLIFSSTGTTDTTDSSLLLPEALKQMGFTDGQTFIVRLVSILVVIAVALVIFLICKTVFKKYRAENMEKLGISAQRLTIMRITYSILRFAILLVAILSILDIMGVNVSGAITALGIVGAVGALAVNDLIKDVITGGNIVSEKYFSIGDVIEFDDTVGKVISLSMRTTKVIDYTDNIVTIQNHLISKVKKISEMNMLYLPLPYDYEREKAHALLKRIAKEAESLELIKRCEYAGINEFADSAIMYTFRYYCDPFMLPRARRSLNDFVIRELDKAGIEIPFMQIDIHEK